MMLGYFVVLSLRSEFLTVTASGTARVVLLLPFCQSQRARICPVEPQEGSSVVIVSIWSVYLFLA